MLKERESLVRNEYDKVLTAKLAGRSLVALQNYQLIFICCLLLEQYDTFVKFSHDQIERRLAASTFSCEFVVTSYFSKNKMLYLCRCILRFKL